MKSFGSCEGAAICGGRSFGRDVPVCREWVFDSREVKKGSAFLAVRGANTDGNDYVRSAAERGAELIMMEEYAFCRGDFVSEFPNVSFITVNGSEDAYLKLAKEYYRRVAPKSAAVTGSVGKTTTRELISAALREKYKVHTAIKNYNTPLGCSFGVLTMPEDMEAIVFEFGSDNFGQIAKLVGLFPPDVAVITEVAPCHLENFGTMSGVLREKTEICRHSGLSAVAYNGDNTLLAEYFSAGLEGKKKISVGKRSCCDVVIKDAKITAESGGVSVLADIEYKNEKLTLLSHLFGVQHAYNMALAFAAAVEMGLSPDEARYGLANARAVSGHGVCRRLSGGGWLVDEAYNASPAAMSMAICNTRSLAENMGLEKRAVLAGMRELGRESAVWHEKILSEVSDFDKIVLLGDEWKTCGELPNKALLCDCLADIDAILNYSETDGAVVLVKGSNSYGLSYITDKYMEAAS
ncbi:MAG: UDP-N-acetylmuramoyl-tripeptide--D-alanyl-D-alanine ligase [Synergistes sp.]|nr:UDP-N-acetylmuramoyl-tripeptide--D-alanyl-D-alanine ligase [Synergistes sp.]